MDMIWYCQTNNSKYEPPGIKLMINSGSVTFEKHKKYLNLGNASIILPIKYILVPGQRMEKYCFSR